MMDELKLKLCDIQGRLFELSGEKGIPSPAFIRAFMTSETAGHLDRPYSSLQRMGEEYLLEDVLASAGETLSAPGEVYPKDTLYWIGYIYRFWHYYYGEDSARVLRQAPAGTMKRNYMMFHTMAPELAVEDLKEIGRQKRGG